MMDPTRSREMPSCSAFDVAEIRRSAEISSWIWSIISGVVIVLGRPGRCATQVEKSPRLKWVPSFWRWHIMVPVFDGGIRWCRFSQCFCQNGLNLLRRLALQEKSWWQLASLCCWNRARRQTCFLSASVTRKDLQFGTRTDPTFQRHYRFRPTTSGRRSG